MDYEEKKQNEKTINQLAEALRKVFGEGEEKQRFIDVSRIPLICQSIINLSHEMTKLSACSQETAVKIAEIGVKIEQLQDNFDNISENFVSNDKFWPINSLFYKGMGIILGAIILAVLAVIFKT